MKQCDAVFEGGGVRGIGLVGAASAFERAGYRFRNLAGSSAGAIVASLLAAGYTCGEIETEIKRVDYQKFKEKHILDRFGPIGKLICASRNFGIYKTNYFENWLGGLLAKKGVHTFKDIHCVSGLRSDNNGLFKDKNGSVCRLQLTATDISDNKLLVLPNDLADFGIKAEDFPVATAVRMSMSIPVFYEPYKLLDSKSREHYIVDGGLLSNFPLWILDKGNQASTTPVFGFRFLKQDEIPEAKSNDKISFLDYLREVASTALEAHDAPYFYNEVSRNIISIPTAVTVSKKNTG